MAESQTRPAGIDGSTLPGPSGVGAYAAKLREFLRKRSRVQLFGEVSNLRVSRPGSTGAARRRGRRALLDVARRLRRAAARRGRARRRRAGRRRRPARLLRGQPHVVAGLLLRDHAPARRRRRRPARPARPAAPAAARRGPFRTAAAARPAGAAAHDRRRHRRGRQGARRRARRPAPARLARAHGVGVRAGPGSPCGATDTAACTTSRRSARST